MTLRCMLQKSSLAWDYLDLCKPNEEDTCFKIRLAKKNTLSEYCVFIRVLMLILRKPTSLWRQVLRRCGPCELSRFCSWLTSCRCLLIGSSSRSSPSVYKVAAPGFYPSSSRVGRGPGRGSAADNPHLWYNITLMWRDEHACLIGQFKTLL